MLGVISDIHGCFNTLSALLRIVKEKYKGIELYSVGDLVDRGKHSFEVIELIKAENIVFTAGNHEYMFLHFMENTKSSISRAWLYNGSEATLASYEGRMEKMTGHLELIKNAPLYLDLKDCFISHAGISTYYKHQLPENFKENIKDNLTLLDNVLIKDIENDQGILWTRDELLDIGKLQVVGHTCRQEIFYGRSNNVLYIDTSAYLGNKLTAVIIEDNKVIDAISVQTYAEDLY